MPKQDEEIKIKIAKPMPWWNTPIVYGLLVVLTYVSVTSNPVAGPIALGVIATILWYMCNRLYYHLMILFNERSLLDILEQLGGTIVEDNGLTDTETKEGSNRE